VTLTPAGLEQARAAADLLAGIAFDRVVTSGLARTLETARFVAPGVEPESWPDLREIESGRIDDLSERELAAAVGSAFRGAVPLEHRFLGGETIGSLVDRVVPAVERLVADDGWDTLLAVLHGAVNRAIISYALTGTKAFFGGIEQAAGCVNVLDVGGDDWVVRGVGITPYDLVHAETRQTTMEALFTQYRRHA
jgi:probable phosphoglycerate mutase